MAQGDVKWFAQALTDICNKIHNLASDSLQLGLVTNATVPAVNTAAPHWGGTGTTNFAANQVGTSGTSYTGPQTLAGKAVTLTATGMRFSASTVSLAQDASGFTNASYGIIFNNTDANKRALGWVDLGSARSLVIGPLTVDWNGSTNSDILSLDQA